MTPLQKAAQALMDAMAQTDFTCRLGEQLDACEKALDAEIAQAVEPDKFGKCIDDFGNSLVSVGDHVESSEAIFFVGAISDGGLCSIDTKKPFYAKSSGPMSKCVTQGNYAAKATALSFVYLQHPPQPQATTAVPEGYVLVDLSDLKKLSHSICGECYMGCDWEIKCIKSMIAAAQGEKP